MYDATFALAQERAGRVRILAVTSKNRMKAMANVPSMHEQGVKDVDCAGTWALMTPKGVPAPIKQKLTDAFLEMARSRKTAEFLEKAGTDPFIISGEEAQKFFLAEIVNWKRSMEIGKMEPKGSTRPHGSRLDTSQCRTADAARPCPQR